MHFMQSIQYFQHVVIFTAYIYIETCWRQSACPCYKFV